jgi:hypothetical protein
MLYSAKQHGVAGRYSGAQSSGIISGLSLYGTDSIWHMAGRPRLYLKLGSAGDNEQTASWYHTDWNVPNPTPIERQLEWLPKELVRVEGARWENLSLPRRSGGLTSFTENATFCLTSYFSLWENIEMGLTLRRGGV